MKASKISRWRIRDITFGEILSKLQRWPKYRLFSIIQNMYVIFALGDRTNVVNFQNTDRNANPDTFFFKVR